MIKFNTTEKNMLKIILESKARDNTVSIANEQKAFKYGMLNSHNNCYINSIVQCLFGNGLFVKSLVDTVKSFKPVLDAHPKLHVLGSFYDLVNFNYNGGENLKRQFQNNFRIVEQLVENITNPQSLNPRFEQNVQQDASEFLVWFIDYLNEAVISTVGLERELQYDDSLQNLFNINFVTKTTCQMGHVSQYRYSDISMIVRPPRNDSVLQDLLSEYFGVTMMNSQDQNKFECTGCGEKVRARQSVFMENFPTYLIIVLGRFNFDGRITTKNDSYVEFPDKLRIDHNFLGENIRFGKHYEYELTAVCSHEGASLEAGHYIAFTKNYFDQKWREFNDQFVSVASASYDNLSRKVPNFDPYILFYTRGKEIVRTSRIVIERINQPSQREANDTQVIECEMNSDSQEDSESMTTDTDAVKKKPKPMPRRKKSADQRRKEDKERKQIKRLSSGFREIEQSKDTQAHREKRDNNPEYRQWEQQKDTQAHRHKRDNNPEYRQLEQQRNTQQHREKRDNNPQFRQLEQQKDTQARYTTRNLYETVVNTYEKGLCEGPTSICVCCGGLFFPRTVRKFKPSMVPDCLQIAKIDWVKGIDENEKSICRNCLVNVTDFKDYPRIALSNGLDFNRIDEKISSLNELEERICSPRIPFLRLSRLGWDRQKGIKGNIVNVPIDPEKTLQSILPRRVDESHVIQLNMKRKTEYEKDYMSGIIDTNKVILALDYLVQQNLFKKHGIKISEAWKQQYIDKEKIDFYVEKEDELEIRRIRSRVINDDDLLNRFADKFEKNLNGHGDSDSDEENDGQVNYFANNNAALYQDTLLVDNSSPETDTIMRSSRTIAPGENSVPLPLLRDQYTEELTFLKIYGGVIVDYLHSSSISYAAVCKSEFRRYDRRCAENSNKLFYSYKKLVAKKLLDSIETSMKKTNRTADLTAADILNGEYLFQLLQGNEADRFMRTLRNSPAYWSWKKSEINAMIRQLGCPTFFITFSPCEVDWDELICVLAKVLENKIITEDEARNMSKDDKCDLLRRDPVTVARYFENRMALLMNLIRSKNGPFKDNPIVDYFWRAEFQNRGSPHIHMLSWHQNAPQLITQEEALNKEEYADGYAKCIEFIDKYITAHRPDDDILDDEEDTGKECRLKYQIHRCLSWHCHVKDNRNNILCKYGFPKPILDETIILEKLPSKTKEEKIIHRNAYLTYIDVRNELIQINRAYETKGEEITLDEFLSRMNITYEEYLLCLRSAITKPTVYIKRNCRELMINQYNSKILSRHRANMDIQYITDPYGAATYVSSYMMKSNAVMSGVLEQARRETENGNYSIKERLRKIANKLHNCSEVSAQEAVYTLLSMPVSRTSRETVFINTWPEEERTRMLKDNETLKKLAGNSKDIYKLDLITHYIHRPDCMENVCLAQFAAYYEYISKTLFNKIKNPIRKGEKVSSNAREFNQDDVDDDGYNDLMDNVDEEEQANRLAMENTIHQNDIESEEVFKGYWRLKKGDDGYVRPRKRARIIRFKRYNKNKDKHNYYRVECLLFIPFRNEKKQIEVEDTFALFEKEKLLVSRNRALFESVLVEKFDDAEARVNKELEEHYQKLNEERVNRWNEANNILLDDFERGTNGENVDVNREELEDEHGFHAYFDDPIELNCTTSKAFDERMVFPAKMSNDDYSALMTTLNRGQHIYMLNFMSLIKQQSQSFYHFISGPAGTGKSRLITAIYQTAIRIFGRKGNSPNSHEGTVFLSSYTGKASFNIRGYTLHTLFNLPTRGQFEKLSDASLKSAQKRLSKLKILIIDEISMVSGTLLAQVNERLKQVNENDLDFGGVSLIVLGDFNQLQPVYGGSCYLPATASNYRSRYSFLATSLWEKLFQLYELNEIMRQRDDLVFANALQNLAEGGLENLSDREVDMFDNRFLNRLNITDNNSMPPDTFYLFFEKIDRDNFNERRIKEIKGTLYENIAEDQTRGPEENHVKAKRALQAVKTYDSDDTGGLKYKLLIKRGCKYMVTRNENLSDGIVNGACCMLKSIIFEDNNHSEETENNDVPIQRKIVRLWVDFGADRSIGKEQRTNLKHHFGSDYQTLKRDYLRENPNETNLDIIKKNISLYTPLNLVKVDIKTKSSLNASLTRTQFPLEICEAMTIHKSQGQTFLNVCICLTKSMTTALYYVALSRVTSLNGLYLYSNEPNRNSILPTRIKNKSKQDKIIAVAENMKNNRGRQELMRMRANCRLEDRFGMLTILNRNSLLNTENKVTLNVMFQNICNQHTNLPKIEKDFAYKSSDIIFLVETHCNLEYKNQIFLNDFDLVCLTGTKEKTSSNGQTCFIKKELKNNIQLIAHNANENNEYTGTDLTKMVELSLFRYFCSKTKHDIFFCCLYKHPNFKNEKMYEELNKFLEKNLIKKFGSSVKLYVLGDFNITDTTKQKNLCVYFLNYCAYPTCINVPTHADGNQLDWCFTNKIKCDKITENTILYETWFGDHSGLLTTINLKQ